MYHDFDRMLLDPVETPDSVINNLPPLAKQVTIQREKYDASDWILNNPEMLEAVPHLKGHELSFKLGDDVVRAHEYEGKLDICGVFGLRHGGHQKGTDAFHKAQAHAVALAQRVMKYARDNNLRIELGEVLPAWYKEPFKKLEALGYKTVDHLFIEY
jgi:hypothetical protein